MPDTPLAGLGFRFRLCWTKNTAGWYTSDSSAETYTVLNVRQT